MSKRVKIFDTTLRDGEQSPGCSMNEQEKLEVAHRLERLKVDIIEAGFAIASPGDFRCIENIAHAMKDVSVCSLARCREKDIDAAYDAIKSAVQPRIHVFIATSPIHMQYKLRMSPEQVLESARYHVKYAASKCADVEFSAEDATRSDPEFLAKIVDVAIKAGATTINIPDTVGYTTPAEMRALFEYLCREVPDSDKVTFSTHCHNDLGMATANSLAGVLGGATQIECTINGIGERAGNTPLEEVAMALKVRKDVYDAYTNIETTQIYKASKKVYTIIGQTAARTKPIVGKNAFAHESGIHQHGVLANKATYEIMTPESVGISKNEMVLGKHSGRHAVDAHLKEMGYELSPDELTRLFEEFKKLCDKKKEVTDQDLEAIVNHSNISAADDANLFEFDRFDVHAGNFSTPTSVIRLKKEGETIEEVALGDGPINASFKAINKIVNPPAHSFENFVIHSVSEGNDTLGDVMITLKRGDRRFNGHGLSTDIIESSIMAYLSAVNKLIKYDNEQKNA
ncbi:MAG: 2-isopropylmalate synthase [Clostridia bacterium]|nr:2-isopropylmalate synthase [Clostridia bacterium]